MKSKVLIGICAHNEEKNIARLLQNILLDQDLPEHTEILVVCSGCTDKTPKIVKEFKKRDPRIRLIVEKTRKGKANALNKIFRIAKETADVLVLVNADSIPKRGSITKLILKLLENRETGVVFARPVPFKQDRNPCYGIVRVIWHLHHIISLNQKPKLSGELCAIRASCLIKIPEKVATDEPYIEIAVQQQGWRIMYVPETVVYIRCPTNIIDLFKQRKRIRIGHLQVQHETNFKVSTSSLKNSLRAFPFLKPMEIPYALMGAILEIFAYFVAKISFNKSNIPYIWEPIESTKL